MREEKKAFWLDLDEAVEKIPKHERILLGADMNEHVRKGMLMVMKNVWIAVAYICGNCWG